MGIVRIIFLILFAVLILSFSTQVLAVNVTISNIPESIIDQSFEFNVSISGAQTGTNYLRANFYSPTTTSYFGYTFNGTDFYNGSDYSQYLPITINSEGSASATIKAKIDSNSSYFKGSGDYNFKVRRYTSASYNTSSNEVTISVNYALPTSVLTPTFTPIPDTPTPTPIPNSPTPIKPTTKPTTKPTLKPTITPSSLNETDSPNLPASILGTSSATVMPTISQDSVKNQNPESPLTKIFLIGGGIVILLAGGLFYTFLAKRKQNQI